MEKQWIRPDMTPYNNGRDLIKKVFGVIDRVEAGESETSACLAENVDKAWFRRFIRSDISIRQEEEKSKPMVTKKDWESWEDVLMRDICGTEVYFAAGLEQRLTHVLENGFTKNEKKVLLMHYKERISFSSIGDQIGLTRERVRRINNNALHKLRNPQKRNYLLHSNEYMSALHKLQTVQARYDLECIEKLDAMKREFEEKERFECRVINEKLRKYQGKFTEKELVDDIMKLPIEKIGFSTRSYNILRRNIGIKTMEELTRYSRKDLASVRGMGTACLDEVTETVYKLTGIYL